MTSCEHHCGNSTYRVLGPDYNTPSWIKWMREHGVPASQVPIHGSWVVRNVADKQVVVLVYDWNDGDPVEPGTSYGPSVVYRDTPPAGAELRMRAFVSQLDREPGAFPTSSDCTSEMNEAALTSLTAEEREHRPRRAVQLAL